jgi:hypothetical protein
MLNACPRPVTPLSGVVVVVPSSTPSRSLAGIAETPGGAAVPGKHVSGRDCTLVHRHRAFRGNPERLHPVTRWIATRGSARCGATSLPPDG